MSLVRGRAGIVAACGGLLVAACALLAWRAPEFAYGSDMAARPIPFLVALLMGAGAVYLAAVWAGGALPPTRNALGWIFAAGALMRIAASAGPPVLEDDYYRYLWDGAVVASGQNPYAHAPAAIRDGLVANPELAALAADSGAVIARVNHPHLRTIYPPVAQVFFAIAHWAAPWSIGGLRLVYFALDCAVFALLCGLLRALDLPAWRVLIYWWNPLLVKECYNSAHMDLLLIPPMLLALLLVLRGRARPAAAALGLAAAIKFWPALLAPLVAGACAPGWRRALYAVLLCAALALVFVAPMLLWGGLGEGAGLAAYGAQWEMNDALFMAIAWLGARAAALAGAPPGAQEAHLLAKGFTGLALATLACAGGWSVWRRRQLGAEKWDVRRHLVAWWCAVAAALFLLSPVQFPWYYAWLLPWLVLIPSRGLLLLTVMLPLYYLKFYFDARGQADFFHYRVVWLEYAPIWGLLLWDALRRSRPEDAAPVP